MSRNHWILLAVVVGLVLVWWVVTLDPMDEPGDTVAEPVVAPVPSEAPAAPAAPATANTPAAAPAQPATTPPPAANTEAPTTPAAEPKANTDAPIPMPERSGPVDELKQAFASEPRASGGSRYESAIEAQFRRPEVPAALLKSVICRTTVCRIETRWAPDRAEGFMGSLMRLVMDPSGAPSLFDSHLGVSPEGDVAKDGSRAIDVYLKRAAPTAPATP